MSSPLKKTQKRSCRGWIHVFSYLCLWLCCFNQSLVSEETSLEIRVRRIQAHCILQEFLSARQEIEQALKLYPHTQGLYEEQIKVLAQLGEEKETLKVWSLYIQQFPEQQTNREVIEAICWGVLNKAAQSPSLVIHSLSLLAAFFAEDAKGIEILYQGMRHPNASVRAMAVELASECRDAKLIRQIQYLFKAEQVWAVRQKVIQAIGAMKIKALSADLEALIGSEKNLAEEKALATAALIELMDELKREHVVKLSSSNRAGLRALACQAISYFHSLRDLDQVLALVQDTHADVRVAALQALGILRPDQTDEILKIIKERVKDVDAKVGITAAWLLTLYVPLEGQQAFLSYFDPHRRDISLLAAGALAATGHYGSAQAYHLLETQADLYVRLNLALGLIGQRMATPQVAQVLEEALIDEKERWTWQEEGGFRILIPRSLQKIINNSCDSCEMDNQIARLEILNLLALLEWPGAQKSIRNFLAKRSWGITGMAAALLLMEGDEAAIDLIQQLLQDENPKVRIQAALTLSLWSREESPIQVLEAAYLKADPELKARILEGLGRIGSMMTVPFLLKALEEPSQKIRLIAAMALLQCLNS